MGFVLSDFINVQGDEALMKRKWLLGACGGWLIQNHHKQHRRTTSLFFNPFF
jgi:hypothetical protein